VLPTMRFASPNLLGWFAGMASRTIRS